MPVSEVSSLDSVIQTVVMDTILTGRQQTVMPNLVRRIMVPEHRGHPFDLPKIGKLTAFDVSEGVDYNAPQALTDTDVEVNPTEVIVQTFLTDRMLNRAPAELTAMISEEHQRAWREKLELDHLTLFSGLSNGLSSAGNDMTLGNFGAARARLKGADEPAPEPIFAVLHPFHAWDVQSHILPLIRASGTDPAVGALAGGIMASNEVLRSASLGTLFGVPVFESGLISVDGNDDAYSAMFSRECFVLAVTDEGSMRPQRDESARGTELNFVGEYDVVERTDDYGYFWLLDATAPTA